MSPAERDWGRFGLPDPPNGAREATPHEMWLQGVMFGVLDRLEGLGGRLDRAATSADVDALRRNGCNRFQRHTALIWVAGGIAAVGGALAAVRAVLGRVAPIIAILALCGGCSLLSFSRSAPPSAMPLPERSPQMAERVREAADLSASTLGAVLARGAAPGAPAVSQGYAAAQRVVAALGAPAAPIPVPEDLAEASRPAQRMLDDLSKLIARERLKEARWRADYERWRGKPVTSTTRVSSPALAWLTSLWGLALIALVVFCPTLAVGVLTWLYRRARAALRAVVAGVESARRDPAIPAEALDSHLRAASERASPVRAEVRSVKADIL